MKIIKGKLYVSQVGLIEHYEFGISPKTRHRITADQRIPSGSILLCTNNKRHLHSLQHIICEFLLENNKVLSILFNLDDVKWSLKEININQTL